MTWSLAVISEPFVIYGWQRDIVNNYQCILRLNKTTKIQNDKNGMKSIRNNVCDVVWDKVKLFLL